MHIRLATEKDAPEIAVVVHATHDPISPVRLSEEATLAAIAANLGRMKTASTSSAYVAENVGGSIAGYCAVHWVPFLFFPGGEAYVTELFVRPDNSGKGVGTALLEKVVAEAKLRGCSRLSLLNGRKGQAYQRDFYKKRGWTEREHMANFVLPLR